MNTSCEPVIIDFQLSCARCASDLRGVWKRGECPDCGLAVSKSLSVAAGRAKDPDWLARVRLGVDLQTWGTLLALVACICGPLVYNGAFSFWIFGGVVSLVLGIASSGVLLRARKPGFGADYSNLAAAAAGSWSIVIPALVLRMATPGQHLRTAILVTMLVGAIFWFVSECSKLHLLEQWATMFSNGDMRQRARNLRWGIYAALATIAAGLIPPAICGLGSVDYLTIQFVLTICVALLVFSLMGTMLQGRLSSMMGEQVTLATAIRTTSEASTIVQPTMREMQVVWGHPPRWSSF